MTEPTPAAPETGTEQATPEPTEQPKPTETVDFWKQKAREQEKRAKENASAAQRLAEIEEANKTEAQKVTDRLAQAEERAAAAERRAVRFEIAAEFSLTPDDAKALEHVASEDGMREVARLLAAKADQRKKNGNHVPREGSPTPAPTGDDAQFARTLLGGGD
jgi:hypothetical protein